MSQTPPARVVPVEAWGVPVLPSSLPDRLVNAPTECCLLALLGVHGRGQVPKGRYYLGCENAFEKQFLNHGKVSINICLVDDAKSFFFKYKTSEKWKL